MITLKGLDISVTAFKNHRKEVFYTNYCTHKKRALSKLRCLDDNFCLVTVTKKM